MMLLLTLNGFLIKQRKRIVYPLRLSGNMPAGEVGLKTNPGGIGRNQAASFQTLPRTVVVRIGIRVRRQLVLMDQILLVYMIQLAMCLNGQRVARDLC